MAKPSRTESHSKAKSRPASRWTRRAEAPRLRRARLSGRRPRFVVLGSIVALALVLISLVTVILWLSPLPVPRLTIMTALYRSAAVPTNAFAVADARTLHFQKLFDGSHTDSDSLSREEMLGRIAGLKNRMRPRAWFSRRKTLDIVYVNAHGVVLTDRATGRLVPYLVPDDFQLPVQAWDADSLGLLPLESLVSNLLESNADQKILVLDCQSIEHLYPLGLAKNQFVDVVREQLTARDPRSRSDLFVLFSCSPGETTWWDGELEQSAFGFYFVRGITGAADSEGGDKNGEVNLSELHTYLTNQVGRWAETNRADHQQPLLETFGRDASTVVVAALDSGIKFQLPPKANPAGTSEIVDSLRLGWEQYYELCRQRPAPFEIDPALWSSLESSLLQTERFFVTMDLTAAQEELKKVHARLKSVQALNPQELTHGRGFSLPLQAYLSPTGSATPRPADAEAEMPLDRLVEELSSGAMSFLEASERLQKSRPEDHPLPIETQLIQTVSSFVEQYGKWDRPLEERSRDLVSRRALAERAATAGASYAAFVFPWLQARVNEADVLRRKREDLFFTTESGAKRVPIMLQNNLKPTAALENMTADDGRLYQLAIDDGKKLAQAIQLRLRLLAELPHLVRFITARDWQRESPNVLAGTEAAAGQQIIRGSNFRGDVQLLTTQLLSGVAELGAQFNTDPAMLSPADVDRAIRKTIVLASALSEERQQVMALLAGEAQELARVSGPPLSRSDWRRLHDVLQIPYVADMLSTKENATVRKLADMRIVLLQRIRQAVDNSGGAGTKTKATMPDKKMQTRPGNELESVVRSLYSLGLPISQTPAGKNEALQALSEMWISLFDDPQQLEASTAREDISRLMQADAACRILDGDLAFNAASRSVEELRRRTLAEFLAWQARRFANDFWAGNSGDSEPYFLRTSTTYLQQARSLVRKGSGQFHDVDDRLVELKKAAQSLEIRSLPDRIYFQGTDKETVTLSVPTPYGCPPGIAALHCTADPAVIELRSLSSTDDSPLFRYQLSRLHKEVGNSELAANLFFRGHRVGKTFPVQIASAESGTTVVYRDERPHDAEFRLQMGNIQSDYVKLLFVLDCSSSMNLPAVGEGRGRTRMDVLRQTLQRFSEETPADSLDVGIRLFGHRVVWQAGDPVEVQQQAQSDTETVLPIRPFDRRQLQSVVFPLLKPTGATPMFRALIEARNDFDTVVTGKKAIIVISDGADNWGSPGLSELEDAFQDSGIRIHAIGFQVQSNADYKQLQSIAAVTGGECARANAPEDLFNKVTGLAGFLRYAVHSAERRYPADGVTLPRLGFRGEPIRVPPGTYDVRVTNFQGETVAERKHISVESGQSHTLLYTAGALRYAPNPVDSALDSVTHPTAGIELSILQAKPRDDGVNFRIAVVNRQQQSWQPRRISIFIRSIQDGAHEPLVYALHNLPPNVPGVHLPAWEFFVEKWPAAAERAEIEVRWTDPLSEEQVRSDLDWKATDLSDALPEGLRIAQRSINPMKFDNEIRDAVMVTLVATQDDPNFMGWSFGFPERIRYSRQAYNRADRIYTGWFLLDRPQPERLLLYSPRRATAGLSLKLSVPVGVLKINPSQ